MTELELLLDGWSIIKVDKRFIIPFRLPDPVFTAFAQFAFSTIHIYNTVEKTRPRTFVSAQTYQIRTFSTSQIKLIVPAHRSCFHGINSLISHGPLAGRGLQLQV